MDMCGEVVVYSWTFVVIMSALSCGIGVVSTWLVMCLMDR